MKVLVDTNVLLDVWLQREPFWQSSARVIELVEKRKISGTLSPTSITTLHYLARRGVGEAKVRKLLKVLLQLFEIAVLKKENFANALESKLKDFEDAVLESIAQSDGLDFIVSRNVKDFRRSAVKVVDPAEFLQIIEAS